MLDGLSQTGGIVDDLIVTGENDEQLASDLYKILPKFEQSGAKFTKSKCVIMQLKIEYFAFVLDRHGIHSLQRVKQTSKSLTKAERNNSAIEKEALAIIFGIRKLQLCLYGRKFTLLTDHQPLTLLSGPKRGTAPIAASRLQRWVIQLSAYQYEIRWRSHADAFSRLPSEIKSENQDLEREAEDFMNFLKYNHIKHFSSAPYHPASNGEAERAVRTSIKTCMKASKLDSSAWKKKISSFLLSLRFTPHTATGCAPAELLIMNRKIRTRLDVLRPDLIRKKVIKPNKLQPSTPKRQLTVGDPVLIQDYRRK
ncbi:uncharacterized protein [Acropora muricata]|uniref:uncharacterized protein n=1 Tax=Acropora muricata TaxID=159855 RepID=UPI0034E3A1B9